VHVVPRQPLCRGALGGAAAPREARPQVGGAADARGQASEVLVHTERVNFLLFNPE